MSPKRPYRDVIESCGNATSRRGPCCARHEAATHRRGSTRAEPDSHAPAFPCYPCMVLVHRRRVLGCICVGLLIATSGCAKDTANNFGGGGTGSGRDGGNGSGGVPPGTGGAGTAGAHGSGGSNGSGGAGGPSGTGGTAAGGNGGTGGSGSGTGGAVGLIGRCPAGAIFCADFETGAIPSQALFFPEYLRPTMSTYVTVDGTLGHNSAHALKVAGTSFSQMLGVLTGTPTFWTRVYLRSDADVSTIMGHGTYVAVTDNNGDPNLGQHVRVGEHSCQLELNRRSDDKELLTDAPDGGVYQCSGGIVFAPNTWYCLEGFYDGPRSEVRVFVDGIEATTLHVTDWGPYAYDMFKFGFENYSSPSRTMWYDDIAIASQRIGCLP